MRSLLLIICLLTGMSSTAQRTDKSRSMSIALREYLESCEDDQLIHLSVSAPYEQLKQWSMGLGVNCRRGPSNMAFLALRADLVDDLYELSFVRGVEFSWSRGSVLNDTMRLRNNINPVQSGQGGLPQGYDGEGIVIGYIDGGLDWNHPDFMNPDSSTRVVYLWKQFQAYDPVRTPPKYGYGRMYDSTELNSGAIGIGGQYVDHGSTVTGTGSGNAMANGKHKGVAPRSDIIVVSSDFNAAGWKQTVADAVDFIASYADTMNKPCVINASLGDYIGSHDGLDAAALYIDSLLADKRGRIMVCAAGNSGNLGPYHLGYNVTPDTAFTWFEVNNSLWTGSAGVYLDVWADTMDLQNVDFSVAADMVSPYYSRRGRTDFFDVQSVLDTTLIDTIMNGADTLAFVEYFATTRGGQYNLQVYVENPDSSQYRYAFLTTGSGKFDLWSDDALGLSQIDTAISSISNFTNTQDYRLPDSSQIVVSSWACSPNVITVGNYFNYLEYTAYSGNYITLPGTVGDITATSSDGPTRKGLIKPDVAATGDLTMSAASIPTLTSAQGSNPDVLDQGGWHIRNGGTSMASPVVAGLAALYLQHCPLATPADFKNRLTGNTDQDAFTGALPNNTFGYGKVNGLRTLQATLYSPQIIGDTSLCSGDVAFLETQNFYNNWDWTTGDSTGQIQLLVGDTVSVMTRDSSWCPGWSDTVIVTEYPAPAQPTFTVDGDTLTASQADGHQWHLNGAMIFGATDSSWVINQSGDYFVQVSNMYGCTANSDTIYVSGVGIAGIDRLLFRAYPNPVRDLLCIEPIDRKTNGQIELVDASGKLIVTRPIEGGNLQLDLSDLESGIYFLNFVSDDSKTTMKILKY